MLFLQYYRFVYFLLVYPISNLELCEVSHRVADPFFFLHFLLT